MNSINLNYIRGLYNSLFDKSDEELEKFDINLPINQAILFEAMARSFEGFGPISKRNIVDGLNFIWNNFSSEELWRNAIPHDLPLSHVLDRRGYLEGVILALTNSPPKFFNVGEFALLDEIGPQGLDFSK
ncbi:hypothetical protein ACSFBI_16685 [Variovorax sp. RB3P1]|jgi:hypothetical protein|uniref:hypothetical protein n=1 Tax=Variovorax sp. RB3P1 TaxID=3443732 RepID=UPI003F45741E